jgi:cyclase
MSHYRMGRSDLPPPQVEEVADGVFAHVQLDGSWGLNNSGFLVGPDAVTVIDTTFTEPRARALREAIAAVTPLPPRTLVNTHHHGDHTWGNVAFRDTTIIAHDLARPEMIASGLVWTTLWTDVDWGDVAIVPASES